MKLIFIPLTIVSIFIIAAAAIVVKTNDNKNLLNNNQNIDKVVNENNSRSNKPDANIEFTPAMEIRIKTNSEVLSALSIRLVYDLSDTQSNPTITINSDLIENNWLFPIKKVYQENNLLYVDIAAVNISPEGFSVQDDLLIATLEYNGKKPNHKAFTFDKDQTKVIRKNGSELILNL